MSLADEIRRNPLQYLPEISLEAFFHFYRGYSWRCLVQGHSPKSNSMEEVAGLARKFEEWVKARFGVPPDSYHVRHLIDSISRNDEDAFHKYFALRDEFLSTQEIKEQKFSPEIYIDQIDLVEFLKRIRQRPPLYFGTTNFKDFYVMMLGDERAFSDLGLGPGEDRKFWARFKTWVEESKNKASVTRPWHKIVTYWGGSGDGGLVLFYKWLDEFASVTGQPGLFHVPVTYWQKVKKN